MFPLRQKPGHRLKVKHGEEGLEVDERVRHAFQESWRMTRDKAGLPTRLTGSPVAHDVI